MAWIKVGDNASTYPALVAVAGVKGAPESAVREMFGWFMACSCYSASHFTDYRVDLYIARREGGALADWLISAAKRTGLMKQKSVGGVAYLELRQDPDFVHIVLKAEKDWERQQQRDNRNPALAVPVRLRDGDQCRYCPNVVVWMGRTSPRRGTFDHLRPGEEAQGPEDLVVACHSCNAARRENRDGWDKANPLQPPPAAPIYGVTTARFLTENGYPTEPNVSDPKRGKRGGSAGDAPGNGVRPAAEPVAGGSAGDAPGNGVRPAAEPVAPDRGRLVSTTVRASVAGVSHSQTCKTDVAGSGRDGLGTGSGSGSGGVRAGTGRDGRAEARRAHAELKARRRGKRGKGGAL